MPNFRRFYIPDALVFITCVTYDRIHYLEDRQNLDLFWQTLRDIQVIHPFHLLAYVILPDHFHWILQIPEGQPNFSQVMQSIKRGFSFAFKNTYSIQGSVHLWQDRFWDHVIRNEIDLERHFDYIHWNPVKHQYVQDPGAWEESSLHHWIRKGYYPASWGGGEEPMHNQGLQLDE
jgi:putative transposase